MRLKIWWLMLVILFLLPCYAEAQAGFSSDPDAIEQVAKSVLMLEVYDVNNELIATGSGFVAFDNRTIVTNYHVIENADWIMANSDEGYRYIIDKVFVADEEKDIAICGFMSPTDLSPLKLNVEGKLKRAEAIVAIGSPIGITNTVSLGNISALYEEDDIPWIQFTAPISRGSSGGALFDNEGRIIGVTSAIYEDAQNINLAVHVSEVANLYADWDGKEVYFDEYVNVAYDTPTPTPTLFSNPTERPKQTTKPTPKPTATVEPIDYEPLKKGDKGDAVKLLQERLIELGYLDDSADGVYGEKTAEAVRLFQGTFLYLIPDGAASNRTQQLLFSDSAKRYTDPDMTLNIKENAKAEWMDISGNQLKIHFEVSNEARNKSVKAFELYVYAKDVWGNKLYDNIIYYWTTNKIVKPGETVYSDYIAIPDGNDIAKVYCGIHKVAYTDGTVHEISDAFVYYSNWDIK